ncbi:MAG: PucR family transcriptional regulator, partial [Nocardioidaceae bacterium]
MAAEGNGPAAQRVAALQLDDAVVGVLRERLAEVAASTLDAITREVPGYTGALSGSMGQNIEAAVQMALGGFLKLASHSRKADPSTPLEATLQGAYALGRGEARAGRSMDALLSAYRVGARVAWREMAEAAAAAGLSALTMARFAELVFAYIDELSAASVAGHSDELSVSGRVRARFLERLGQQLLSGAAPEA